MAEGTHRTLLDIRKDIDAIDDELVALLSKRVELAQEVGLVKGKDNRPYFTPERERQIYEKLDRINPGPLRNRQLSAIFREIISAARAIVDGGNAIAVSMSESAVKHSSALLMMMSVKSCVMFEKNSRSFTKSIGVGIIGRQFRY